MATTLYHATPYNGLIEEINLDTAANTLSNAKEYGLGFYTSYSIGNATEGGLDAGGSNMAGFLYTMEVPDEKDWGFDDSHGERFINLDKPADEAVVERLAKAFESFQGEDHNDWQIHADALRTDFSEMVARRNQMDLPYSRTENFFQIASARLKGVESNFTESDFLDRANIDFVQVNSGNLIFVNSNNLPTIKPYDSYYSSDKSGWLLHELNVNQMNGSLLLSPDVDLKMRQMIVTTSLAERNNDITAHEKLQELKQFMSEKIADMPEGISDILQKAETSTQKITADAIERARPENFNYDEMARNTVIDIHINHINDKILVSEEYQARYSELVESGHWDQSRFDNAMLKANEEFAEAFVNHPYRMDDFVDGRRVDISKGYLRDFSEFMRDANPQIQEASQEFIKQALIMRFEGSGFRHEAGKTPGLAIRVIGDDQYGNMNNALKAALKGDFHWNGFGLDDYASGGSWGHSNLKESATKLKQGIQSTIDSKPIQALDDVADLSKAAKGARAAGTIPVVGAAVGLGSAVLTNQAHAGQQDYATELHAQGILDTEALNAYNQINNKYDKLFMGDAVGGGAAEFLPVAGQVAAAIASVSIEVGAKRGFENWADIYAPNLTKEQYQTLSMSLFTADSARTEMILNAAGKLPNATDDEAFTAVVSARNSYYEARNEMINEHGRLGGQRKTTAQEQQLKVLGEAHDEARENLLNEMENLMADPANIDKFLNHVPIDDRLDYVRRLAQSDSDPQGMATNHPQINEYLKAYDDANILQTKLFGFNEERALSSSPELVNAYIKDRSGIGNDDAPTPQKEPTIRVAEFNGKATGISLADDQSQSVEVSISKIQNVDHFTNGG